jgi:hypothetical protein
VPQPFDCGNCGNAATNARFELLNASNEKGNLFQQEIIVAVVFVAGKSERDSTENNWPKSARQRSPAIKRLLRG